MEPTAPSKTPPASPTCEFDADYLAWRAEQLAKYDRDYAAWREAQVRQHDDQYRNWRSGVGVAPGELAHPTPIFSKGTENGQATD